MNGNGQHAIFNFDTPDSEFDCAVERGKSVLSSITFTRKRKGKPDDTVFLWLKTEWLDSIVKAIKPEMAEKGQGQGLRTNRIELVHIITNFIEGSDTTMIEDRDDAAMLAIRIVDGLEDEVDRQKMRALAVADPTVPIKCPECGAIQEGSVFLGLAHHSRVTCKVCDHVASLGEFRKETPGYKNSLSRST